ncbi:uncharacterized protein LOC144376971 [Ictidomys tridecemlineatus]
MLCELHMTFPPETTVASYTKAASAYISTHALRSRVVGHATDYYPENPTTAQHPWTPFPVGPLGERRKLAPPLIVRLLLNGRGRERPRSVGSRQQLRRLSSS